ncbi:hypothetical protein PR048_027758 [Dryococelus australis]|uniref:Uncharacterized protein n=1 Tax=Dryococelus australis TaxID=614101 RepID=A0ABQ9GHE0_9NEOP|nr:hypothetical protein PR048_027758 [Dryococelus australis]
MKLQGPNLGLLANRATPLELGFSLAELLFGRKLRTTLPVVQTTLQPQWEHEMLQSIRERDSYLKTRSKMVYDKRHGVKRIGTIGPRRQVVKVPEEDSRKWVPVKATNIQGAADTA